MVRFILGLNSKKFFIIILFEFAFLSSPLKIFCQNNENWLNYFNEIDKEAIRHLSSSIKDLEKGIYGITGTFGDDSILWRLKYSSNNTALIDAYNSKIRNSNTLISIYDEYIENTKGKIDSLKDYKDSAENSLNDIITNKIMMQQIDTLNKYDSVIIAENLVVISTYQENIIKSQKQFFTFFSIIGIENLISRNEYSKDSLSSGNAKNQDNSENVRKIDSVQFANVVINEEIVESIKISLQKYKDDSTLNFYDITNFDIDNLTNIWNLYLYNEAMPKVEDTSKNESQIAADFVPQSESNEGASLINERSESTNQTAEPLDNFVDKPNISSSNKNNTTQTKTTNDLNQTTNSSSNGLLFRVQIAAARTPIDAKGLSRIYKGPKQIEMFQEEGWYKYYIAETETFKEAIITKKESGVDGAFIMAYKDGQKVQYYLKYVQAEQGSVPPENFIDLKSLSFEKRIVTIQIAAARTPISDEELKKIYTYEKPLNYIFEDGWHKYSYGNYDRFWPANFARRKSGVKGAFVVGYENGEKVDLWKKSKLK